MKVLSKLHAEPGLWMTEADMPTCQPNDVLIKIKQTAICGTDLHIYQWDEWAQKTIPVPMHVGHEFIGEVVEVGSSVTGITVGDRVSGEGHITCGHCRNCRAGHRHLCRNTLGVGVHLPGAFAEYLVLPATNVCSLPDHISDEMAAILDPFGNAVHTALAFNLVGEDVLITGAGPVGLMAAAIARHVGALRVVITDMNPQRLALAEQMGATLAIHPEKVALSSAMETLGMKEGFDVAMEMSGSAHAFTDMISVMNNGGRIAFLGIPPQPFETDWSSIVFKGITVQGIYGRRMFETWYKGMAMLQSGLDVSAVLTDHFPVDDYEAAFQRALSGDAGKVILHWSE